MEILLWGLGALVLIALLWLLIFSTINKNVKYRIIQRSGGYCLQIRGKFKWLDIETEDGPLLFQDKVVAGMVLDQAVKSYEDDLKKGK